MQSDKYETGEDFGDLHPYIGTGRERMSTHYVRYAKVPAFKDRFACQGSCHDFGSAHISGWNVVMADGSVHSQDYGTSLWVHWAQGSIAGGEQDQDGDPLAE